jgi:hypothetical protein
VEEGHGHEPMKETDTASAAIHALMMTLAMLEPVGRDFVQSVVGLPLMEQKCLMYTGQSYFCQI